MTRSRRAIFPNSAFHLISRGNNKQDIFHTDRDKFEYYRLLIALKDEDRIVILHYCLMSSHIHLIAWLTEQSFLSRFMKQVNQRYCRYYQKLHGYSGHLWQGRFKSFHIDREEYLLQCGKYIELNPVRAGIVKTPEEFKFSSYRFYAFGEFDMLLNANPVYLGLSKSDEIRRRRYREFVVGQPPVKYVPVSGRGQVQAGACPR